MSDQEKQLGREPKEGELDEFDLDAVVGGKQTLFADKLRIDRFGEFYLRRHLRVEKDPK